MDINYELYKVFYHVAITLSFSEASKQLFISQSAVSQSIKILEKKLNQVLFIRSTKRVQLTPEGEILFKHIEPAMNLIKQGENQLLEAHTLHGGQLRIGASDTICRYYLVPYLNQFHKRYPHVHIKVTNQTSIECARLLEHGQVDFIVVNYPNSALAGSHIPRIIKEFHDVFVANEENFPLRHQPLSLSKLQTYPILMLDRKSTTSEF
ncbi:MAG: LysR family transcriptional regulator, partial [Hungatella sp.]